jgi:hypothetical protein
MNLIPLEGTTVAEVATTPEALYAVASDVTRIGDWSHECKGATWHGGAQGPAVGARFRGRNRTGWRRWSRLCEVTVLDPPNRLAWRTVGAMGWVDSTEWQLTFTGLEDGRTRITQHYRVLKSNPLLRRFYSLIVPTHLNRSAALTADLLRLGEVATRESTTPRPTAS